jgi:1,2-phenylacetyl-CoA epoxidase PaaB subunit
MDKRGTKQKAVRIYDVFARQRRKDPLIHVGTVTAPNADLAAAYARSIYNEEPWIEMRVVAQNDEIIALELEESFA